jgi:hypothetical protein
MTILTFGFLCVDNFQNAENQMSSFDIVTLVFTSSVLSAGLTALVNWIIQKRNYRNEYYKKLLDKRLNAYEEVEALVSQLTSMVSVGKGQMCNLFCHMGQEYFREFLISVRIPMQKVFWLSDSVSGKLTELNIFLINEIENKINERQEVDQQLIELGIKNVEKIRTMRKQLQAELYKDLRDLHDIKKFVKGLRGDEVYLVYDKPENFKKSDT